MKDLGTLPNDSLPEKKDPYSEAWAINDRGQVVGESGSDEDHGQAFLYTPGGSMKGLDTLPGQPYSEAFGINNSGQIVGWSYSSRAAVQGRAFIYRNEKMEDLGTLPGDTYSMARAIDEHGRVVGQSRAASGTIPNRAFLWENGEMTDLNSLVSPNDTTLKKLLDAYAISESGQIVGSALNTNDKVRAFLLTPNDTTTPKTTATISPEPNAAGWNNSDVTVTLNATDTGGSNLKEIRYTTDGTAPTKTTGTVYTAPIAVSSTTTIKYLAVDNAGNAEAFNTFQVNIDKTKPTVGAVSADKLDSSGTPMGTYNAGDWTNNDVKVSWTCSDGSGSGPVNASGSQTFTASGSVTPTCEDQAGNPASGTAFAVKIDKANPTVGAATAVKLDSNGNPVSTYAAGDWTNKDVKVSWTCTDADSGAVNASGSQTITTEGASNSVTPSCEDNAGNTASGTAFSPIKIDKSAPKVTYDDNGASVNADFNDTTWRNTSLSKEFTASDVNEALDVSGIDLANSSPALTNNPFTLTASAESASAANPTTVSQIVKDVAGNSTTRKLSALIDKSAPNSSATATVPDSNADADNDPDSYSSGNWTNQNVTVSLSADDGSGSGVNVTKYTTNGDNPATNGTNYTGAFTISAEGTTTVKYLSTDNATNQETTETYTVKIDKSAPSVSGCSVTPSKLNTSANNHKLVTVTATAPMLTDSGGSGPNGLTLFSVTSSQPDSGLGPDDVPNDIQGWTTGTNLTNGQLSRGKLRAERYGGARVYTLTYQGKDLAGNTAECKPTVTVPKGG
jgi:probable HAF family extracellular repeat protein